jgi:acetyltransferase-like isoleucine patch superfamily enzyme
MRWLMDGFFEKAFLEADDESRESFYRTVFMNDSSEYAEKKRTEYYKSVMGSMGDNVTIGTGVKIKNPQYVHIGNNVTISDGVTIIARGEGGVVIGDNVRLQERVYLDTEDEKHGYIRIGKSVYVGTGTTLFGHRGLEIGDKSLLAQNINLTPYSHIFEDPDRSIISQGGHTKKVTIGSDVYIGMGVCIMYSGDVGDGSVIGAGSVVVKPIPPYSVAVGCPAKVIRKRCLKTGNTD